MPAPFEVSLLDHHHPSFPRHVDRLRAALGAPTNPTLFPPHFLKATFPRIGGRIVELTAGERIVAAGFLFPRAILGGVREYTLRFHHVGLPFDVPADEIVRKVSAILGGTEITYYDPTLPRDRAAQVLRTGPIRIGRPDAAGAHQIRELQQIIWGSEPDYLYPADIHAPDFGLGTSLLATSDEGPVGFLFGFYRFDGSALPDDWRERYQTELQIESQLLGVLPRFRSAGLAAQLKGVQAEEARQAGIDVITWTVDPLQFPNAVLNLGRLRAVAFDFYPDYYDFRNDLNRVPASRLGITWLVRSRRVVDAARATRSVVLDLAGLEDVICLNDGAVVTADPRGARRIAIEIPSDWNTLQATQPALAARWREVTDQLFATWLGADLGRYLLTDVGRSGDRCYLVGERVSDSLLDVLAE